MPRSPLDLSRRRIGVALSAAAAAGTLLLSAATVTHALPAEPVAARLPASLSGTVVNAATGNPLARIPVTLRDVSEPHVVLARDRSNAHGVFQMGGLTEDEYGVYFNGVPRGFERGYLGCFRNVVPTWGAACSFGVEIGDVGKARLEHL